VLDPGRGRTKTGQLWAYARDDRPWGGADPPAVAYVYAPDRIAARHETAKLNGVDPQAYLTDVITRIVGGHPQSRVDQLMPGTPRLKRATSAGVRARGPRSPP